MIIVPVYGDSARDPFRLPKDRDSLLAWQDMSASSLQLGREIVDTITLFQAQRGNPLKARLPFGETGESGQNRNTIDAGISIYRGSMQAQRFWLSSSG